MNQPIDRAAAKELEVAAWDNIAPLRARELDSGRDLSFKYVLAPGISGALAREHSRWILDLGCGTGRLLKDISREDRRVVGLDPSPVSIDLAKSYISGNKIDADLFPGTAEDYAKFSQVKFDAIISNMVFMDVIDLDSIVHASHDLAKPGGRLIFTITHPFYWPEYWGYHAEPWFNYSRETYIRSEFKTSTFRSGLSTLHVHRPLEAYVNALTRHGFVVERVAEPVLPGPVQRASGVSWKAPHFMLIEARKKAYRL